MFSSQATGGLSPAAICVPKDPPLARSSCVARLACSRCRQSDIPSSCRVLIRILSFKLRTGDSIARRSVHQASVYQGSLRGGTRIDSVCPSGFKKPS